MNTPAPKTSPDAALGNLMAAALDVPAAPEQPAVPDDTLARTGNTADHQAGWFAGMEQGQANAQDNAAMRAQSRDWKAIQVAIDEYLDGYELRADEGAHTPTDFERFLLDDCIAGLLADDDFLALMAGRPAIAVENALTAAARDVLAERQRQVSAEGWTPEQDDRYTHGDMASAAACYANQSRYHFPEPGKPGPTWPWAAEWWKPSTYRRNLEKAGALILAEIERLDRAAVITAHKRDE
ncbi:hypothetical protein [Achromobacter ruhlandii]|uniref:hypothetical protein n=1 Tax=Achromobacter ruhlandii TaxID=72557 RepID=UPI0030169176